MSVASDAVAYLTAAGAGFGSGTIFAGPLPDTPADCVAVSVTGGEPGSYGMGASLDTPGSEPARLQVLTRATSYSNAEDKARQIHSLLRNLGPLTMTSGKQWFHCEAVAGGPAFLRQDDAARYVLGANYRIEKDAE